MRTSHSAACASDKLSSDDMMWPASAWASVAWLIVMSSVVSYFCWYYAIRRLEPSRVAVFINLQPIGTALAQWALFALPPMGHRNGPRPVRPGRGHAVSADRDFIVT